MATREQEFGDFCSVVHEGLKAALGMLVTRAGSGVAWFWVKFPKASFAGSLTLGNLLNISKPQFSIK